MRVKLWLPGSLEKVLFEFPGSIAQEDMLEGEKSGYQMSQSAASSPCTHHTTNEFASLTDNKLDNEAVQRLD